MRSASFVAFALLWAILIIHVVILFAGCSAAKKIDKLQTKHPELFKKDTVIKNVIQFVLDTPKVNESVKKFDASTDSLVNILLAQLDSCSNTDKQNILNTVPEIKKQFRQRFEKDCPGAIERRPMVYKTKEGHSLHLTPNNKDGYDVQLVVNCPDESKQVKATRWDYLVWGVLIGIIVGILLTLLSLRIYFR